MRFSLYVTLLVAALIGVVYFARRRGMNQDRQTPMSKGWMADNVHDTRNHHTHVVE